MAEKIRIAELNIDSDGLVKDMVRTKEAIEAVSNANKRLKDSGKETSDTFVKNEARLKTLKSEYTAQQKVLQAVTKAQDEYTDALDEEVTSLDAAAKNNKKLKEIRNQVNASTKEGQKQIKAINEKLNSNTKFIKENTSDLEKQYQNIGNYASALDGISPKLGIFNRTIAIGKQVLDAMRQSLAAQKAATVGSTGATSAFSGALKILKFALIATGIGAIVVVLGSLVGMLANTQKGTDFVSKAMAALGAAFDVITDRISAVGGAFAKFFSGDFEGGFNDLQEALSGIGDEIANEASAAYDLERALQAVEDREISLISTQAKRKRRIEELRIASKDEQKSLKERADLLKQATDLEQANLNEQLEIARERARISQEQVNLGESTREELRANEELQAKVFEIETQSLKLQRSIVTERESLLKRDRAATVATANTKIKETERVDTELAKKEEARIQREKEAEEARQQLLRDLRDKFILEEDELAIAKIERETEKHLAELETLQLREEEKAELEKAILADKEEQLAAIREDANNKELKEDEKVQKQRLANRKGTVDGIIALTNAETGIGKAALIAKQILAAKEQAVSLGLFTSKASLKASESAVDTAAGVTKSAAAAPFPANLPLIAGFLASVAGVGSAIKNAISAGKGAASGTKFAKGGILQGNSHANGGIPTRFGELEGGEAVINKRSTALFRPLLSRLNEAGGGKKFATGGILGDAGTTPSDGFFNYDLLAEKVAEGVSAMPSPVVGVDEIVEVANRVDAIETAGDF